VVIVCTRLGVVARGADPDLLRGLQWLLGSKINQKNQPSYKYNDNELSYRGGKRLGQLVTLFVAIAITPSTLLAQNNQDQRRFVDPIVGSWIIHIHFKTITPPGPLPPDADNIAAFWEDGITTSSDPTPGATTSYGLWKKMGPGTYLTKIVQINSDPPGSLAIVMGPSDLHGDVMTGTFQAKITDSTGTRVFAQVSGEVTDNRITFDSTP
jgi:hypothetical protein